MGAKKERMLKVYDEKLVKLYKRMGIICILCGVSIFMMITISIVFPILLFYDPLYVIPVIGFLIISGLIFALSENKHPLNHIGKYLCIIGIFNISLVFLKSETFFYMQLIGMFALEIELMYIWMAFLAVGIVLIISTRRKYLGKLTL